ncbi:hypothetical protein N356_gp040 [Cellulophaga phage phi14:2]|uniref:Uncharacterized protein n=1 Tax=Cellulophaga phage phi14:2 TaxID=1327990 RepID=S0A3B4_9CAUD|nr:hypothetical protein N356_gp040 [Cellulophaga phage phi14:2]AGO48932.1 hypothetical protein Phi14:2_gp054 [Cellulophaga phage phi14:2]
MEKNFVLNGDRLVNTSKVTRVEIIKEGVGRQFVDMDCEIDDIQLQDNHRTMKIFIKDHNKK